MKTSPKDIFLQLFATAMLYLSIIATFIASFTLVDWYIKSDVDRYPSNIEQLGDMLSFPLAMLVVAFPLFIWSTRQIGTRMKADTSLQNSRARAWLINLTLFLAALIVTITAITVVYSFFDGDLTMRTLLKSAIVLLVSAMTIIGYKGAEEGSELGKAQPIVLWASIALFLILLIVGVVSMGSPSERRMMREDRDLLYDVQQVYYAVQSELMTNSSTLPADIDETPDGITYERGEDTTNTALICTTFQTEYEEEEFDYYGRPHMADKELLKEPDWSHGAGEHCYSLELL